MSSAKARATAPDRPSRPPIDRIIPQISPPVSKSIQPAPVPGSNLPTDGNKNNDDHEIIDINQEQPNNHTEFPEQSRSPCKQQTLPAFRPKFSVEKIYPALLILGLIALVLGILNLWSTGQIQEYSIDYTNCESIEEPDKSCADIIGPELKGPETPNCTCNITLNVEYDRFKDKKVLMFYKLTNFYQNHRKYQRSRDLKQVYGEAKESVSHWCGDYSQSNAGKPVWPCGAMANSMFQDEIRLWSNISGEYVELKSKGITRYSEEDGYKNPKGWDTQDFKDKFDPPKGWKRNLSDGVEDEDFKNWMRPAAFSNFRKLYRITEDLQAGAYVLEIKYSYPVHGFGGTKSIILTTETSLTGSTNPFVGITFVVIGAILILCGILSFLFRFFIR